MKTIIKKGDKDAFTELITLIDRKLYAIARARLNSDADAKDAIQDTIFQIYRNIGKLKKIESFNSWSTSILINSCNFILRQRLKNANLSYEELEMESYFSSNEEYIEIDNSLDFFTLIENLSIEERTITTMYYSNEYTSKEISEILNINENTIRTKLARAKFKVKEYIKNEKKIENILRLKYNEIQVPFDVSKFTKDLVNKENKRATNITFIRYASVFSIILLLVLGVYYYTNNGINIMLPNENVAENNNEQTEINQLPVAQTTIQIDSIGSFAFNLIPDYIVVAKVDKIVGYTNYSQKLGDYTYPITEATATIQKSLKGNLDNNIEFFKWGGVISLSDLERLMPEVSKEKMQLNLRTENEKKNALVNVVSSTDYELAKLESGKTYLICLRYDNLSFDKLAVIGNKGIMEYDEKTNMIKDTSTNKWIELDLSIFE